MRNQISRRTLLTGAAGAFAAVKGVRFGVRTPFPNVGLRERAQLVHSLGYDGIELGREWLNDPFEKIEKEIAGTGVAVSAIVGSIQLLDPDPQKRKDALKVDRERLELARRLGAECVIEVPTFGENRFPSVEVEDELLIGGLQQLTADVKRAGVTLLLEPCNRKETHFLCTQGHGADLISRVGAPGFKLLSDFYHMQIEEKDIGETLGRVGEFTGYVHLADGAKRTEPGSLPFDYRPGFRALKKWGYAGWLTVESKATDNPEAALGRALQYLKRQWAEA